MSNQHSSQINRTTKVSANIPLLRTKLKIYASLLALIAFAMFIYVFFMHGLDWFILAVAIFIGLMSLRISTSFGMYLTTLNQINNTLLKANKGQLTNRITETKGQGEVGKVAWELNEFFDLLKEQKVNSIYSVIILLFQIESDLLLFLLQLKLHYLKHQN